MNRCFVILLIAISGTLSLPAAQWEVDLSQARREKLPSGFKDYLSAGQDEAEWKVIQVPIPSALQTLTPNAPNTATEPVIAQVSRSRDPGRIPVALYENEAFGDFSLTLKVRIAEGIIAQEAGIMFRSKNDKSYYVVRLDAANGVFAFTKVNNGTFADPIAVKAPVKPDEWHEVNVTCKGNQINLRLDNKQLIPQLSDNTFNDGYIGLWTRGDTQAHFKDISLDFTRRTALAQQVVEDMFEEYSRLFGIQMFANDPAKGGFVCVGSTVPKEVGQAADENAIDVIETGSYAYGTDKKAVTVVLPLRDRNGTPVAAVRFRMRRYFGQTQNATLGRVQPIMKKMQQRIHSAEDLLR